MEKHSSPMMQLTKRRAAFRVRQLLDELHMLMASFPDLHDAFDPDELPIAFIIRRDSRLTDVRPALSKPSPGANSRVRRSTNVSRAAARGQRGKRIPDE